MGKTKHTSVILACLFIIGITVIISCKKTYTPPPKKEIATGPAITIAQLRPLYQGINVKFTSNTILYGVVTMDETSGNIYKQVYLRDASGSSVTNGYGAISLHLLNSAQGFLYTGDSIAINLNGSTLDLSGGGTLQIDSVNAINQIVKIKTGLNPQPIILTIPQITIAFDGQLVQLNNVEFFKNEVGLTYAIPQNPPAAPVSINRHINDCVGNSIISYNSGYANFAGIVIPDNNGIITGIVSVYSNTVQFTIRSFADVALTNSYCAIILYNMNQTFYYGLTNKAIVSLPGWQNLALQGSLLWTGLSYGISPFNHTVPSASTYHSLDARNDMWLITPPIQYHNTTKYMNFKSATQYNSPGNKQLSVLVSSTFDGVNIIPSQWTDLTGTLFPYTGIGQIPNFFWASNNQLFAPLVPFTINGNPSTFYVAFRYQGNATDSTATEAINSIIIRNHP